MGLIEDASFPPLILRYYCTSTNGTTAASTTGTALGDDKEECNTCGRTLRKLQKN
jgi:hypothetical protein